MQSRNLRYLVEIDQLRFVAAGQVFVFHFFHVYKGGWVARPDRAWMGLITEGHTGVSLFFVLSGFIFMTIAQGGEAIDYRIFLRNRILRIAPLYLVIFVIAISMHRDRFVASDLLYLLVTNIGDPPTSWHFITGPAWSISVEFAFYLIFPFLAMFQREYGLAFLFKLLILLLLTKIAIYCAVDNSRLVFYSTVVGRLDQFIIGMLAAIAYRHGLSWPLSRFRKLLAGGLVAIFAAVFIQARFASYFLPATDQLFWIFWGSVEAACWSLVIVGFTGSRLRLPFGLNSLTARIGVWSYSVYMWHALVIFAAHSALGSVGGTGLFALMLNALVVFLATLVVAWLSFTAIEQPFLGLRKAYVQATVTRNVPKQ